MRNYSCRMTQRFTAEFWLAAVSSLCVLCAAPLASAQALRTTLVVDGIYLITGTGGNVTLSVGDEGIMLVDSGTAAMGEELLATIRDISDKPILYIVNTGSRAEQVGGNPTVRNAGQTFTGGNATAVSDVAVGAAIVAHENTLHKLVSEADIPSEGWPTEVFFQAKHDLYFNNEPVVMTYQPAAVDNTNLIVHFRRSDVISTGDVFRLDSYPYFDVANGGSINGILNSLNALIELAVSDKLAEGGTLLIPGHGRISDEGDLVRYRDMVTILRDRVQAMLDRGLTLDQVKAAGLSLDYDSRYGSETGPWSTGMFIEAVYQSLAAEEKSLPVEP